MRPQFAGAAAKDKKIPTRPMSTRLNPQSDSQAPTGSQWPSCEDCGSSISPAFARVCGDNQGRIFSCIECVPQNGVASYAGKRSGL